MEGSGSLDRIRKHIPQIKEAIASSHYEVTPGDVSVATGLPILEVGHVLKELVSDYYGELKVSDEGDLIYFFPTKFRKNRYGVSGKLAKGLKKFLKLLYKGFQILYKASIMIILVLYFLLFLVLFLVIMFASRSGEGGGNRRRGGGFNIFFWMWLGGRGYRRGGGYDDDRYYDVQASDKPKKPFYKSVFDFVFGEDDPNDFLYNNVNKIVARFIQKKNGAIIPQELTPVTNTRFRNANIEVTKYVGKFESQPEVTDNGTVILTFPKLLTTSMRREVGKKMYESSNKAYYELQTKHNGNTTTKNVIMCIMNGFNLIVSWFLLTAPVHFVVNVAEATGQITKQNIGTIKQIASVLQDGRFFFGGFPFVFSLLFFLIPLIRLLYVKSHNKKTRFRNLRKAVSVAILDRENPVVRADSLILPREAEEYIESYTDKDIEKILDDMASSSSCNVEFDSEGKKYYDFSELITNLKDVQKYRRENIVGKRLTERDIDFNTNDEIFDF